MTSTAASSRTHATPSAAPSYSALRLLALIALAPAPLVAQTTFTWTGALDSDWNSDGNWNQTGAPALGDDAIIGASASVLVSGGASAANIYLNGGSSSLSVGSGATLDIGSESQSGMLTLGVVGDASLTVNGGGVLTVAGSSGNSVVGRLAAGTATVDGPGSSWTTGNITVGFGAQGTLNITGGGAVNSLNVDLANGNSAGAGGTGGTVFVTGSGSQWNVSGTLKISRYVDETDYNSGALTIADGASVTVDGGTGTVEIYTNGSLDIGSGALAGVLNASQVSFTHTAAEGAISATLPVLRFDHTDDITFATAITGDGQVIKDGSGSVTLTAANTYTGPTLVNAGTFVIDINGVWAASTEIQVSGSDTVLRIASGSTVGADLAVTDSTVEVAGTLADNPVESTFDGDASLHVLSNGTISDGYFTFSGQSSLVVDEGGSIAFGDFYFDESATFVATGTGAVTDGIFGFGGNRTITLPAPGVITAAYIELYDNVSTDLNQTGMILSYRDEEDPGLDLEVSLDLYNTSHATISATAAVDSSLVTLWDQSTVSITATGAVYNSLLDLGDDAVVTLGADNALNESGLYLGGNASVILNGYDATLVDFVAYGGRVVNNSADSATLTLDLCGCYPVIAVGDILADRDDTYVGPAGALSLIINGTDPDATAAVFFGVQRHTGSTTVNGATLVVFGADYDHDNDLGTDPVLAGFLSSPIILNMGSVLTGTGPVNSVTVNDGSGIAPGDGVGTLVTGPVTLSGDTNFFLNIANFAGVAGTDWGVLNAETFSFSTGLGDTFTVYLSSMNLDPGATDNLAAGFDPAQDYSLAIIVASGGITDFSVGATAIDSSGIDNPHGGTWSLRLSGDSTTVYLDYTAPIPEPASAATLAAMLAALSLGGRRRRRA